MAVTLSAESRHWQERAREVAERVVRPLARTYDERQEYPWEIREALAEAGLFKVWIPKAYGGLADDDGQRVLNLCLVVEQLSRACGGVGVLFAVNALGSLPILLAGTEEQKRKYLPRVASGEWGCAFCLSEKGAGSDAQSLRVRAERQDQGWRLWGEKKWTTNGGAAEVYTVFAVTDPESLTRRISAFLVEKDDPGFSIGKVEDKMGIRCVPVVEVLFEGVPVGDDRLLGGRLGHGFRHAMATLDMARPGVAAQAVGLAQGALELALVYGSQRRQFGQPITSFGMIQNLLADMATRTEAARHLVHAAAEALEQNAPARSKLAAMCKCFATDTAVEVTTQAVQIFGGYGFMRDYPIEKYLRDAKITQIYEGTNQIQRLVMARSIIGEAAGYSFLRDFLPDEEQELFADS